jgi:hypothetical protein
VPQLLVRQVGYAATLIVNGMWRSVCAAPPAPPHTCKTGSPKVVYRSFGFAADISVLWGVPMFTVKFALAILVLLLACTPSHATLIQAATCRQPDVAAAARSARAGDTVAIPACSQTNWTTTLNVNKCISIQGAGQTNTTLGDNVAKNGTDTSTLITYNVRCPSITFTIHDFTIVGVAGDPNIFNRGHIRIGGSGQGFRVYNITGSSMQTAFSTVDWVGPGLFDHNLFPNCGGAHGEINMKTSGWGGASNGNGSWSDSSPMPGSANQIYIEDNSWNCSGAAPSQVYDGSAGARWVFRFNTVTGGNGVNHGTDTSQAERGARFIEIYQNTWNFPSSQSPDFMHWYRSGTGMVWGNKVVSPGGINSVVKGLNCRDGTNCGSGYAPWGFCNGKSPYDQNSTSTGYRCVDQPGSGTSNAMTVRGGTPTPVAWVGNILDPIYQWLNKINGGSNEAGSYGQLSTNVALNRDVYRGTILFDGTTGVGVGILAKRPATCTPFVAYWATDQGFWNNETPSVAAGQLYKCTARNTWTLWYVPYTYPHPLQQLPTGGRPAITQTRKPAPKSAGLQVSSR